MKIDRILLVALIVLGCATPPVADLTPGEVPAQDTDEAGLWQAVERDEYKLQTSSEVIRDPELQNYLKSVFCRVSPEYCDDIRMYVIPSPRFNAFMAPNGMMGIFTGMLLRVQNEAQLAAVLSHEVAHYSKRHTLKSWRALKAKTAGLQTFGAILSAGVGVATASANAAANSGDVSSAMSRIDLAQTISSTGSALLNALETWAILSQLQHSRESEAESDEIGQYLMARNGYDPSAFEEMWQFLEREEQSENHRVPSYLRTHPLPQNRMISARNRLAELKRDFPDAKNTGEAEYQSAIRPFRNRWLHSARVSLDSKEEKSLLQRQREIGVEHGLVLFHEADMYRKRNAEVDSGLALDKYRESTRYEHVPPEAYRDLGILLWEDEHDAEAKQAFEEYLSRAPSAPDAAMIQSYLEELP